MINPNKRQKRRKNLRREGHLKLEEEVGLGNHNPRNDNNHQELERNRASPRASGGSTALRTP